MPFLTWVAVTVLCVFMVLLYFLPLRYLVLAWGKTPSPLVSESYKAFGTNVQHLEDTRRRNARLPETYSPSGWPLHATTLTTGYHDNG